jgi:chemotaxis protein MotB
MSDNSPIIIRKKRGDEEGDHHGGVWKLAFADFMTAMMAFFLVMWLINSTTKETKAVIVQYFNPVQLVDSNPAHKGLRDPKQVGQGKSLKKTDATEVTIETTTRDKLAALHKEPLKALEEIAQKDPAAPTDIPEKQPAAALRRDPFDRVPKSSATEPAPLPESETPSQVTGKESSAGGPSDTKAKDQAAAGPAQNSKDDKAKSVAALQHDIEQIAAKEAHSPKVEVKRVEDGLLISLTDDANFSMFDVGSIEPKPQLVRIIGQIGKILAARPGEVELRGHTDARSYSSNSYDNWRLSSDRANVVNYMLQRGGMPAARIGKIVGFADRRLKNPKDPFAPVNRRIEILLRGG